MSYIIKENRIAKTGVTRRVALHPLKFRNQQVTALNPGEYIRITVFNEDGTDLQAVTDANYDLLYVSDKGVSVYGWTSIVSVGTTIQQIKLVWEVQIGAGHEAYEDYIDVIESVFADRSVIITGDAEVV